MLKSKRFWLRVVLISLIVGGGIFALSLREFAVNENFEFREIADDFVEPTFLADDGHGRLYVTERIGKIWIIENGERHETPFLDLTDHINDSHHEQGLFSIVFAPDFDETLRFYINYTDVDGHTRVVRYVMDSFDQNMIDVESGELILSIEQPTDHHNAGMMDFGVDGYLYISSGDGGLGFEHDSADNTNLLGTILRINVSGDSGYTIPDDNPFVDDESVRGEIWAYGLRNPWRFSFDYANNMMFIADVGHTEIEEINYISLDRGGYHFGWPNFEGYSQIGASVTSDEREAMTFPMYAYEHARAGIDARIWQCAIVGGYIYQGEVLEDLQGYYIYGDWCSGTIWTLHQDDDTGEWVNEVFMQTPFHINSFAEDSQGELYLIGHGGEVLKLFNR